MKKAILIIVLISLSLVSCISTRQQIKPEEIQYKEISAAEYFNSDLSTLYIKETGYKINNAFIVDAYADTYTGRAYIKISSMMNKNTGDNIDATEFVLTMNKKDSNWANRMDSVSRNTNFNGHYTVYVYKKEVGNWLDGYSTKVFLYTIGGIPSQDQIDADKEEQKRKQEEKDAATAKAIENLRQRYDEIGKEIADGYIYHGINELDKNWKLFENGALASGHAYYIGNLIIKDSGRMAAIEHGDGVFISYQGTPVYIDYINLKVKSEVIDAGFTSLLGKTYEIPVTVVVAGGKGDFLNTPVILGIIPADGEKK